MPNVQLLQGDVEVPIANVFLLGKNYLTEPQARAAQRESPLVVCMKPNSTILLEPQKITLPAFSAEVHYELELVLLIGEGGQCIEPERAMEHVLGYGVGLDLTALDLQQQAQRDGLPWMRCKSFAGGAPVSRFITAEEVPDPQQLRFSLHVNGKQRKRDAWRIWCTAWRKSSVA